VAEEGDRRDLFAFVEARRTSAGADDETRLERVVVDVRVQHRVLQLQSASTTRPSARTTSAAAECSIVSPKLRPRKPMPPVAARPPTPTSP
jgi:hypothetical protein